MNGQWVVSTRPSKTSIGPLAKSVTKSAAVSLHEV